jgi:hypothetical protein
LVFIGVDSLFSRIVIRLDIGSYPGGGNNTVILISSPSGSEIVTGIEISSVTILFLETSCVSQE